MYWMASLSFFPRTTLAVRFSTGSCISIGSPLPSSRFRPQRLVQQLTERRPGHRIRFHAVIFLDGVGPEPDVLDQLVAVLEDSARPGRRDRLDLPENVQEQVRVLVLHVEIEVRVD